MTHGKILVEWTWFGTGFNVVIVFHNLPDENDNSLSNLLNEYQLEATPFNEGKLDLGIGKQERYLEGGSYICASGSN